jgi:hypothetical protein
MEEVEQNEPIVNEFGYTQRQDKGAFDTKRGSSVRQSTPEKVAGFLLDTAEVGVGIGVKLPSDAFNLGTQITKAPARFGRHLDLPFDSLAEWATGHSSAEEYLDAVVKQDIEIDTFKVMDQAGFDLSKTQKEFVTVGALLASTVSIGSKLQTLPQFANKATKLANIGNKLGLSATAGAGGSLLTSDLTEHSVVELLPESIRPEFVEWLMDEDDDTEFDTRFKNFVEDTILGGAGELAILSVTGVYRGMKNYLKTLPDTGSKLDAVTELVDAEGKATREVADDIMDGSIFADDVSMNTPKTDFLEKNPRLAPYTDEIDRLESEIKASNSEPRRIRLRAKLDRANKLRDSEYKHMADEVPEEMLDEVVEVVSPTKKGTKRKKRTKEEWAEYRKTRDNAIRVTAKEVAELEELKALGKLSPEDTKLAEDIIEKFGKGNQEELLLRNSPKRTATGDDVIEGSQNVLDYLARKSGFKKKKVSIKDQMKYIAEQRALGSSSKFMQALKTLSDSHGYDTDSLLATMTAMGTVMDEATPMILAIGKERSDALIKLKTFSKILEKKGLASESDISAFLEQIRFMDKFDAGLQGVSSPAGRALNALSANSNTAFKRSFDDVLNSFDTKRVVDGAKKAEKMGTKTALNDILKKMDPKDQQQFMGLIRKVANASVEELSAKNIGKTLHVQRFNELVLANGIGGLIAKASTVGGVFIATAIQFAFNQTLIPAVQIAINTILRKNTGATASEFLYRYASLYDSAKSQLKYLYDKSGTLKTKGRQGIEFTNSTTHMKHSEIVGRLKEAVSMSKSESQTKGWIQTVLAKPLGWSMTANNFGIRRMEDFDGFFRRMSIEMENSALGHRLWHQGGIQDMFEEGLSKENFMTRFKKMTDEYTVLKDKHLDGELTALELEKELKALTGGKDGLVKELDRITNTSHRRAVETTLQESTDDTVAGTLFAHANRTMNDTIGGRFTLASIFPFQKSPVNAMRATIEHSPLAVTSKRFRRMMTEGTNEEKVEALSRVVAGTSLMAGFYALASSDSITGSIARGSFEEMKGDGAIPYGIRLGDTWYSYEKFGVFKPMLSSIADFVNHKGDNPESSYFQILGMFISNTMSDSHMSMMEDLTELMTAPDKGLALGKFVTQKSTIFIDPARGLTGTVGDLVFDEKMESTISKEVNGIYDNFRREFGNATRNSTLLLGQGSPIFGSGLKPQLDVFGAPEHKYGNSLMNRFMHVGGLRNSTADISKAKSILRKYNLIPKSDTGASIEGFEMSQEQYANYKREVWQGEEGLLERIESMVRNKSFDQMSEASQEAKLKSMISDKKNDIKRKMRMSTDGFYETQKNARRDNLLRGSEVVSPNKFSELEFYEHSLNSKRDKKKLEKQGAKLNKAFSK